jgi:excisionase family DNA binding protein
MSEEENELLTVEEVARLLRVPKSWVYERSRAGSREPFPHLKLGKYLRFHKADVQQYLERMRRGKFN